MSERKASPGRRKRRLLSPEEKWEIFLEVTSQELTQADELEQALLDLAIHARRDLGEGQAQRDFLLT